jgi:hypothetical protein
VNGVLDQGVRLRCGDVIRALPIPQPFDLELFRVALGRWRGRGLRLVPTPGMSGGLWLPTMREDHIFYPRDASTLVQLQVIAREIGHMVFGHVGGPTANSEIARLLLPCVDPSLLLSTVRTAYSAADEEEAATFAVLLLDYMEVRTDLPPRGGVTEVKQGSVVVSLTKFSR